MEQGDKSDEPIPAFRLGSSHAGNVRRAAILQQIHRERYVLVMELAVWHQVSVATIRRDLQALERQGRLRRFRGGARGN